ncbi:MAG: hypothetical protein KKF48_00730 [Nanoarchaeota archaeon]|nr:hypothetical protein [Nanoarchaeota archaeon]MBU1027548.1 hypothetical protein [Nanoarchaeota archaeon]
MSIKILNKSEKQEILNKLKNQFGITDIQGLLVKCGAERIFLFQGSLNQKEIKKLEKIVPIERVGIYFAKEQNNLIRLSIDGILILKNQIKKNIFELNQEQMKEWMCGNELNINSGLNDFVIIKYKNDFLGTGKASENKITNFIPKARRLKK